MTDQEYPEPLVVELEANCAALGRLPRLPVRILVLSAPGLDDPERKGLADRLSALSDELGAADGVSVTAQPMAGWSIVPGGTDLRRFDVVVLRPDAVPPEGDAGDEPSEAVIATLGHVLADLGTRLWVLDPPVDPDDADDDVRRMKLCRRLVERGAPPVVMLPPGWSADELRGWHVDFLERILHDAPLSAAVSRATAALRPVPAIFQPAGGRFGLDLGRLLEDHRQRVGEASSGLRIFEKELEAARPPEDAGEGPVGTWAALDQQSRRRAEALDRVREALDEIHRDRDPAGWSRLGANVAELRAIEDEEAAAREQLRALRTIAREASGG